MNVNQLLLVSTPSLKMSSNAHAPKPFQLEFKTDRDNLNRWWSILTNFCRQKADQLPFFKGGAHENWITECKDPTRGKEEFQGTATLAAWLTFYHYGAEKEGERGGFPG